MWEQKTAGDWSYIIEWQLDEDEYKDISNRNFEFEVFEKLKKEEKHKGKGSIKLTELKNKNSYGKQFEFDLKRKKIVMG